MKKWLSRLFFAALTAVAVEACDIEHSSEGNLYGFWHLEGVERLDDATISDSLYGYRPRVYWAVQGRLVQLVDYDGEKPPIVCRWERQGDSLFFSSPHFSDRDSEDPEVTDVDDMLRYGLPSLAPAMAIEGLSTGKLSIRTADRRMKFRKL